MHSTAWASYREAPFSASRRILHCSFEQKKKPSGSKPPDYAAKGTFCRAKLGYYGWVWWHRMGVLGLGCGRSCLHMSV